MGQFSALLAELDIERAETYTSQIAPLNLKWVKCNNFVLYFDKKFSLNWEMFIIFSVQVQKKGCMYLKLAYQRSFYDASMSYI